MYKSYSYSNMPVPVKEAREVPQKKAEDKTGRTEKTERHEEKCVPEKKCTPEKNNKGLLGGLETDDIILIAVALVLLNDDCDDKLLLLAIAFILFSDKN